MFFAVVQGEEKKNKNKNKNKKQKTKKKTWNNDKGGNKR